MNPYHLLANPVEFVAAEGAVENVRRPKCTQTPSGISGAEAKKIYEGIVSGESSSNIHEDAQKPNTAKLKRKQWKVTVTNQYKYKDLYCAAQTGDLKTVKDCVCSSNLDLNATDAFSWTPLMMAAHEGHSEVVLFLLSKGAQWIDQIDGSGYDARELACLGGHPEIVDLLMNSEQHIRHRKVLTARKRAESYIKREKLWCDTCKSHYFASPVTGARDSHATSTLHLISDEHFPPKCHSHFYIPHSNKGFQLLQREGWNGESGIGPNEDGAKYPVKTVLKRDRFGIGSYRESSRPKVTHFKSFDESAVKGHGSIDSSNSKRKKYLARRAEEEREREIQFRRLFH